MSFQELLKNLFAGERDGEVLWKIPLGEIQCDPIVDPAEGVVVASLAENILRFGLLQPILLRKLEESGAIGEKYALIAGRRRLEAVRMLGRTHVQAIVVKCTAKQASAMRLAENLMRKNPHYLELAKALFSLEQDGWSKEKLSTVFSIPTEQIGKLESILLLPSDQMQAIRRIGIELEDLLRLMDCTDEQRRAILRKCITEGVDSPSELIKQVLDTGDVTLTQQRKGMVRDIRVFQNSVEKAIAAMQTAGYQGEIHRIDKEDSFEYRIAITKTPQVQPITPTHNNVSRETSTQTPAKRFSVATSIFAALAEEECAVNEYVSRETYQTKDEKMLKNQEKLEICIDE